MSNRGRLAIACTALALAVALAIALLHASLSSSTTFATASLVFITAGSLSYLFLFWIGRWKAWRWRPTRRLLGFPTPFIHGRWEGSIRSTYSKHAVNHPVAAEFSQTIDGINVWYYDVNAITRGLVAGFSRGSEGGPSTLYCVYQNQPIKTDQPKLKTHNGVMELYIEPSETRILGVYYNNPHQRQTYGDIDLRFVGRKLRGTHVVEEQQGVERRAEIAVLTVIPAELQATRKVLGISEEQRVKMEDGTIYYHGTVATRFSSSPYRVVLACIGGAGNPGAAAAARDVINYCNPLALFLVGIAAGIRGKVKIGDVVFSERVVAYEPAALVADGDGHREEPRPEIERAAHTLIQDLVSYAPEPERLAEAFQRIGGTFPVPPQGREDEFSEHVATSISAALSTIASGEKLLRDPSKLLEVRRMHGKTEVGEMEAAGVVEACRRGTVPWLVVRGISDFGDDLKDDQFHAFAAGVAASVLSDFLVHGLELTNNGRQGS